MVSAVLLFVVFITAPLLTKCRYFILLSGHSTECTTSTTVPRERTFESAYGTNEKVGQVSTGTVQVAINHSEAKSDSIEGLPEKGSDTVVGSLQIVNRHQSKRNPSKTNQRSTPANALKLTMPVSISETKKSRRTKVNRSISGFSYISDFIFTRLQLFFL